MSFQNMPDLNPDLNIKFENAINLLLTSISMEEMSISKLLEVETSKLSLNTDDFKTCKDQTLNDVDLNKSVNDTIKNMLMFQMLLQLNIESIKDLIPSNMPVNNKPINSQTQPVCQEKIKTQKDPDAVNVQGSETNANIRKECTCSLTGKGKGSVTNSGDEFFGCVALLETSIHCKDIKNRKIRYFTENDDNKFIMTSSGYNVKILCPAKHSYKLIIYGRGCVKKSAQNDEETGDVNYILTVWKKVKNCLEYRMETKSDTVPALNHDSGYVQVKSQNSDMQLSACC